MRFIIMPSFGGWGFQDIYKDLLPVGAPNFGGIIATLVSNPMYTLRHARDVREAPLHAADPAAARASCRCGAATSSSRIVPGSIFTLLTTQYAPTIDIGFQYSAHFIPYVFSAAARCLAAFGNEGAGLIRRRAALVTLVGAAIICGRPLGRDSAA